MYCGVDCQKADWKGHDVRDSERGQLESRRGKQQFGLAGRAQVGSSWIPLSGFESGNHVHKTKSSTPDRNLHPNTLVNRDCSISNWYL
jgi:hypothetical protein